jgi:hypothetical protein
MTTTALSDVADRFMMTITDYRLTTLFNASTIDFENYLEAWLVSAIDEFDICDQPLVYDTTSKLFSVTLTSKNVNILSQLMIKYWAEKNVRDITQINLHVGDRDFKIASEANNLKEKQAQANQIRENCSQMLIDYAYKANDWSSWFLQDFTGA